MSEDPAMRAIFEDLCRKANKNQPLQVVRSMFYLQFDRFNSFTRYHWYTWWISAALTVLRDNRADLTPLQATYLQAVEEEHNKETQRSIFVARDRYISIWHNTSEVLCRPSANERKQWTSLIAWMANEMREQKERDQSGFPSQCVWSERR